MLPQRLIEEYPEQFAEYEEGLPLRKACDRLEREYIRRAMDECNGSVAKAAEKLGIHRSLLYKKLNRERNS